MSKIYVALDFPTVSQANEFVAQISPNVCGLKVGSELFLQGGADLVRNYVARGFNVFLDLKFHDIPNTVAAAAREATLLGVRMFTLHASGGARMIAGASKASMDAAASLGKPAPIVLAVTVLTSMNDAELASVGVAAPVGAQVKALAATALGAGATGLVCSALEAASLRATHGAQAVLVTPGIRLAGEASGDQARVVTPIDAMRAGASALVIGRSITQAKNPVATLETILRDLA